MTKQEQIEEMAMAISNYADKHDWELHEPELEDLAIELYNAGYRKEQETAKEILLLLGKGYDETEKTEFNNLQWYKEFCRELKHRYGVEVEK